MKEVIEDLIASKSFYLAKVALSYACQDNEITLEDLERYERIIETCSKMDKQIEEGSLLGAAVILSKAAELLPLVLFVEYDRKTKVSSFKKKKFYPTSYTRSRPYLRGRLSC